MSISSERLQEIALRVRLSGTYFVATNVLREELADYEAAVDALERLIEGANAVQPFPVDAPNVPEWSRVQTVRLRDLYDDAFSARAALRRLREQVPA